MSICVRTPKWLDRQRSKASTIHKVSHRKSCLMLPPYFARASLRRMLKTMALGSSMEMPSLKTPVSLSDMLPTAAPQECPGDFLQSSIQLPLLCFAVMTQVFSVANVHRISLPEEPIPVLTCVPNEGQFDETCSSPGFEQLVQLSLATRNCVPTMQAGIALEHAGISGQPP